MATDVIFVGFQSQLVADIGPYLTPLQAPSNYKDPVAIANYVKGRQAEDAAEAALSKLSGQLTRIFAVNPFTEQVFDSQSLAPDAAPAVQFAKWLEVNYGGAFCEDPNDRDWANPVTFWGFDVKEFLRMLGVECLYQSYAVPLGLWYRNEQCYDPYAMLVEEGRRKRLELPQLLAYSGMEVKPGWQLHQDAAEDGRLLWELIARYALVTPPGDQTLSETIGDDLRPVEAIEPLGGNSELPPEDGVESEEELDESAAGNDEDMSAEDDEGQLDDEPVNDEAEYDEAPSEEPVAPPAKVAKPAAKAAAPATKPAAAKPVAKPAAKAATPAKKK